jgi:carbonic anhydrase
MRGERFLCGAAMTAAVLLAAGNAWGSPDAPIPARPGAPVHRPAVTPTHATPPEHTPASVEPTSAKEPAHSAPAAADHAPAAHDDAPGITPELALTMLSEGNARWVQNSTQNPSQEPARRERVAAEGQHPFVTVLSCADSRVPVERLFDRGVGEVFTVRVAGVVGGDSEVGTIEYGVGHLKTPLLVVMGHSKCGAVAAASQGVKVGGKVDGILARIDPAVERARRSNPGVEGDALVEAAVRENVWQTVFNLFKDSPTIRSATASGKLQVVGAVYDIASGRVDFMGEHPWQEQLLGALNAAQPATASAEHDTHDQHK